VSDVWSVKHGIISASSAEPGFILLFMERLKRPDNLIIAAAKIGKEEIGTAAAGF
jgi:hypothetical protein